MTKNEIQGHIEVQRRKMLRSALAFIAGGAALTQATSAKTKPAKLRKPPAAAQLKPEKRTIHIATTSLAALPYLPLLVAQQKGFFAAHGLELEMTEHQSAARAMQSVATGAADAVCGWLENTLSPAGRAMQLQSFVLLGRAPMMALGVPVKASGQIESVTQLRGRKLGVIALNSPTHTVALAVLRSAGLRASDVGIVSVGSATSASAALRSGQIDGLVHMDPLMQQLEQRAEISVLADLRSPQRTSELLGMDIPSSCLSASADFLQRFPGTAQACADAMLQALQWLHQASLRDMLAFLPDGFGAMDAQSFVASFSRSREAYSKDGQCSEQELKSLWRAMMDAEPTLRLEAIDPLRSSSNVWIQRGLAKLRSL
jgi:NitT/TauT family transport system substrate-binding protein